MYKDFEIEIVTIRVTVGLTPETEVFHRSMRDLKELMEGDESVVGWHYTIFGRKHDGTVEKLLDIDNKHHDHAFALCDFLNELTHKAEQFDEIKRITLL